MTMTAASSINQVKPMIYVVDDNEPYLSSLKILWKRQYQVEINSDPALAVSDIRKKMPHVIVLDIHMPQHDGFWVCRKIREFSPNVPIIFNSAFQDSLAENDVRAGLNPFAYMTKGDSLNDLETTIQRALQSIETNLASAKPLSKALP